MMHLRYAGVGTLAMLLGAAAVAQPARPGELVGWGTWGLGAIPPLPQGPFTKISVGPWNALFMRPDGTLVGWPDTSPYQPPPGPFVAIEAGGADIIEEYYIGIRPGGMAEFWGSPIVGQSVIPPGQYAEASWWARHGLLLRQDGSMVYLGVCTPTCTNLPAGPFQTIDMNHWFGVGIRPDGTLHAWGVDPGGQGVLNPPPGTFLSAAVGWTNAFAIRTDKTLAAWGDNWTGQLNLPSGTFDAVDVGDFLGYTWSLGLRTDGSLVAWGYQPPEGLPVGKFVAIGTGWTFGIALAGCYADCNDDGQATVADFGCYQTRFVMGSPYADCTGEGQLTVADFGCFQTQFVLGCP